MGSDVSRVVSRIFSYESYEMLSWGLGLGIQLGLGLGRRSVRIRVG